MNMKKIYKKVAKQYGVSVQEVEREIQAAIMDAYANPMRADGVTQVYQDKVPRRGEIPTPDEVIRYLVTVAKEEGM